MLPTLWQRLETGARHLSPLLIAVLFTLAGVVPWPLPYIGPVVPSLSLIAIYYWTTHRPDVFGSAAVCMLGLLQDAINFQPLGLSALIFVVIHQLIISQRRFFVGHSFFMLWSGFSLTMLTTMMAHWIILSLYNWQWITFMPVLLQALLTIALFPLPAWVLIQLQRVILTQE